MVFNRIRFYDIYMWRLFLFFSFLLLFYGAYVFWDSPTAPPSAEENQEQPVEAPVTAQRPSQPAVIPPTQNKNQDRPREHSPENEFVPVTDEEKNQVAATGFVRDTSRPSLGESYRDRHGLIWGEIWRKEGETEFNDGASQKLTYAEAEAFCARDGNRLPTKRDYDNLIADFGGSSANGHIDHPSDEEFEKFKSLLWQGARGMNGGYNPFYSNREEQMFPTLLFQRTWTSTPVPGRPDLVWVFNSKYGTYQEWNKDAKEPFLCVFNPKEKKPGGPR